MTIPEFDAANECGRYVAFAPGRDEGFDVKLVTDTARNMFFFEGEDGLSVASGLLTTDYGILLHYGVLDAGPWAATICYGDADGARRAAAWARPLAGGTVVAEMEDVRSFARGERERALPAEAAVSEMNPRFKRGLYAVAIGGRKPMPLLPTLSVEGGAVVMTYRDSVTDRGFAVRLVPTQTELAR